MIICTKRALLGGLQEAKAVPQLCRSTQKITLETSQGFFFYFSQKKPLKAIIVLFTRYTYSDDCVCRHCDYRSYDLSGSTQATLPGESTAEEMEARPGENSSLISNWSLVVSVQRSEEFHSGTGRDGIEVQSRDPGIFRDGISLIFQSRDCLEIVRDFSGLAFLMQLVII